MRAPGRPGRPGRPHNPIPRSRLLEIAREVFAESGYAAASLSDIARRAGIRKASLFHHFSSKQALYLEAVSEIVLGLQRYIVEAKRTDGRYTARLDRLAELVVRFLGTHRSAARLLLRELVEGGPFLTSPQAAAVQATLDATVGLLAEGTRGARRHPNAARHHALSIIGLHLFYFAADELSGRAIGKDIHSPAAVEERTRAVIFQVRRIAGQRPPRR